MTHSLASNFRLRMKRGFLVLFTATLLYGGGWIQTASADRLENAENLVGELLTELKEVDRKRHTLTAMGRMDKLAVIMETYFDVDGITKFTAGRYWRAASSEQRQTYSKLFRGVLLSEASTRFDQILTFSFTPKKAQARGDKLILVSGIASDITGQIPDTEIIWRLSAKAGEPIQIIDLEIENISMLKTQQDENTSLIKRNGGDFNALIDAMRTRLDAINAKLMS